jgi:DMSO/TMAO reductase YedYZ molybdopterin-dependent catalytic subunit
MAVTRGFTGRPRPARDPRLPPGQYDAGTDWPVLHVELVPDLPPEVWSFTVDGLVATPTTWSWDDVGAMPRSTYDGAIHCVTTWSKFDMTWVGVSVDHLLAAAGGVTPGATHVLVHSHTGYTTNLPLADVTDGRAWLAFEVDGGPLPPIHGGPARLLVPHLYFWKSAKWASRIEVLDHDQRGYWEDGGYHDRGDPWREQRYHGD